MNKIYKLFIVLLMLQCGLRAQDMHFTQFYASPLYLNPAFAGADVCGRASITYRNQWPGIYKTYKSYLASIDHYFQNQNIGAGLLVASDVAGSGNLRTTLIDPMISYQFKIDRHTMIRAAIQPGIGMRSIDFNNLLFGDQIGRGGNVATVETPTTSKTYFDVGCGALLFTKDYWAGFSAYHLNRPDESLTGAEGAILPVRFTLHGGYKYLLSEDAKELAETKSVTGVFHYRHENNFDQLDIGAYYSHGFVSFGAWYRGLPFKHYKPGYRNVDAIALILGIKTKRANIGYSFDMTISQLAGFTKGAHEVTLSYQLCKPGKKKKKIAVPCPKF
jgi:type IX secretion system PorP/SprF family membrane protein